MTTEARYFAGSFGLLTRPLDAASGLGVVICGPFGFEAMTAYRPLREWSDALAADGHLVLRLELPGTGDSPGGPRDPGLMAAWHRAVSDAVAVVRAEPGVQRVAMIGIGLGGLLALSVQQQGTVIDDTIVWATPGLGSRLIRELQAFAAFENVPHDEPGAMVAGGYRIDTPTLDALRALDVTEWRDDALRGRRVLMLGRADGPPDARLKDALEAAGAEVTIGDGREFTTMTVDAARSAAPRRAIEAAGRWLADGAGPPGAPHDTGTVTLRERLTLEAGGATVHEQPLWLQLPDGQDLFAIQSGPGETLGEDCIVLLNAGGLNRTGPNRMWVELARRWAARGVSSVRVDLAAIGESRGDARALSDDLALHTPAYVEQVVAVLDLLEREHGVRRFVLMGLCSGAYLSFQAALRNDRVAAAVMINPRLLTHAPDVVHRREAQRARRIFSPRAWCDLVRHWRQAPSAVARVVIALARRAGDVLLPGRRQASTVNDLLDQLAGSGTRALFLFTGSEPLDRELAAQGLWDRLERWPTVTAVRLPDGPDTHTLRPVALQAWAHEQADREIAAVLGRD